MQLSYRMGFTSQTAMQIAYRKATVKRFIVILISLLSLSIIPAEFVLDFGIVSSDRCKPIRVLSKGICARFSSAPSRTEFTAVVLIDAAKWDDKALVRYPIRQGFRRTIDGNEYFGPDAQRNLSLPVVVAGCVAGKPRLLPSKTTNLTLHRISLDSPGVWVVQVKLGAQVIPTTGMTFRNNDYFHALTTSIRKTGLHSKSITTVFEYANSKHISHLTRKYGKRIGIFTENVVSPLVAYNVSCSKSGLPQDKFALAILHYRLSQLVSTYYRKKIARVNISYAGSTVNSFRSMIDAEVSKAAFSFKLSELDTSDGETFIWTTCGSYRMFMAFPMFTISVLILLVWTYLSCISRNGDELIEVPTSAQEWMLFALKQKMHFKNVLDSDENEDRVSLSIRRNARRAEFILADADNGLFDVRVELGKNAAIKTNDGDSPWK